MATHFFGDTAVLTGRTLRHVTRSTDTIITTAIMPIAMMVMFVYVFGGAIDTGSTQYVDYMLPGTLLITIASGISYTAFRLFMDLKSGIFERFQSMPIARSGVLWAQVPHLIDAIIAQKHEDLHDPDMVRLYQLVNGSLDWPVDDPRVVEVADIAERLMIRAVEAGAVGADGTDDQLVALLDSTMVESSPHAQRVVSILEERGWRGWTRIERVPADRLNTQPGSVGRHSSAQGA